MPCDIERLNEIFGVAHRCRFKPRSSGFAVSSSLWPTGMSALLESFHADARADEVAIAIDVVDAADRGPEFVVVEPFGGETGLFARIRTVPVIGGEHVGGVG